MTVNIEYAMGVLRRSGLCGPENEALWLAYFETRNRLSGSHLPDATNERRYGQQRMVHNADIAAIKWEFVRACVALSLNMSERLEKIPLEILADFSWAFREAKDTPLLDAPGLSIVISKVNALLSP